jgi:xanthine phosphoribosyltransferase
MIYYSYEEMVDDLDALVKELPEVDAIVAIARGGVTFGHMLSEKLEMRSFFTLNSVHYEGQQKLDYIKVFNIPDLSGFSSILLVDDISDSGDTLNETVGMLKREYPAMTIVTSTVFCKKGSSFTPDFHLRENAEWVEFFWSTPPV